MTLDSYPNAIAALCIWREARGESKEAQLGVLWVLLNRKNAQGRFGWPVTLNGVVTQPRQFSSFNPEDPNAIKWPLSSDPIFQNICRMLDSPGLSDPTLGANHYHSLPDHQPFPKWADPKKLTVTIGHFKFYKL